MSFSHVSAIFIKALYAKQTARFPLRDWLTNGCVHVTTEGLWQGLCLEYVFKLYMLNTLHCLIVIGSLATASTGLLDWQNEADWRSVTLSVLAGDSAGMTQPVKHARSSYKNQDQIHGNPEAQTHSAVLLRDWLLNRHFNRETRGRITITNTPDGVFFDYLHDRTIMLVIEFCKSNKCDVNMKIK